MSPHTACRRSNPAGTAGFVISLFGLLLTCGILCPLGLFFSLVGLTKSPRGTAVAGTILGLIGTLGLALAGFAAVEGYALARDAAVQPRIQAINHAAFER